MNTNRLFLALLITILLIAVGYFVISISGSQSGIDTGSEFVGETDTDSPKADDSKSRLAETVPGGGEEQSGGDTDNFKPVEGQKKVEMVAAESDPAQLSPVLVQQPSERSIADILEGADLSDPVVREQIVEQARATELAKRKVVLEKAERLGIPLRIEQEDGRVMELFGFDGEEPIYRITLNRSAAIASGASVVLDSPYGLNGSGINVGVWDEGSVRSSHVELINRTSLGDPGAGFSNHGTHVAGTIGASGVSGSARGMAPSAQIFSYDWNSDLAEMLSTGAASAGETGKISVSNHSYGIISGYLYDGSNWRWYGDGTGSSSVEQDFGRYNSESRDWDAVAYSLPYLTIFKAAGNDRPDNPSSGDSVYSPSGSFLFSYSSGSRPEGDGAYRNGYENQSYSALAKNIITIGAVNDAVSGQSRSIAAASMSGFSCWGPTDDGRIKPDLVANGVSLYSTFAGGDNDYRSISGTSMASPSAAGSAALIVELYRNEFFQGLMRSSLLKGVLIHTADDLGTAGPDYQNGWGHINVNAAADLILEHKANLAAPRMIESVVTSSASSYVHEFEWDGSGPIRATLCWNDPAGSTQSAHDSRAPNLVNNLDLTLTAPNGQVFRPFVMPFVGDWSEGAMAQAAITGKNNVDNVEQVFIAAPSQVGEYTVTVSTDGTLTNGRQAFALLLSGVAAGSGNENSRILRLSGNLSYGAVEVGQSATRSVTVQNVGNASLTVSRIELPFGFSGNWSGTLASGASASFDVTFSPVVTGPTSGSVRAYSDADNGVVSLAVSGEGVAATLIQSLINAVPVNGLSGQPGSERFYKLSVPTDQSELRFEISGSGDADIYIRYGSLPTLSEWDYRPYLSSSNEEVVVTGPVAGDWYVMIRGYTSYSDLTLLASYESSALATRVIELQGDLDYGNIPVGDSVVRQLTIRNQGNSTLTVTGISLPAGFSGSWSGQIAAGGSQVVGLTFAPLAQQVYLGQINVASNKTSGTNTRSISGTGVITQVGLQNGVTAGPFSGLAGNLSYFYIDVPSGQSSLHVELEGADGEADLYLAFGSAPTLDDYDLRSSDSGHDDTLTVNSPAGGRWFIMLHAVTQITEIRLVAEYQDAVASQRIIRLSGDLDFGSVRINQSESRELTIHNDGDVALSVFGLSLPQGFSSTWSGTVQPGDSRSVIVYFNPTAVAAYSGMLSVQSDATSGTPTAAVTGQGVSNDSIIDLQSGIPVSALSGSQGSERIYRIRVPASVTLLSVSISGSNGDADLYLSYGTAPTLSEYDYAPYLSGSNETVDVGNPASGDWFIMLHAYTEYSGLTLTASFVGSGGGVSQFTNTETILLDNSGEGSLYPSAINVSGLNGIVEKVTVTLHDLFHTYPADIDLLLVSPDGTSALLMSDAGRGSDIAGLELTFDDDASSALSDSSQLTSGVYRPTNYGTGDSFPTPAPGGSYSSALSNFSGLNPNGTWSLYLFDDAGFDSGSLAGGWTLEVQTDSSALALPDLTDGSGTHDLSPANTAVGEQMEFSVDIANQGGQASGSFELLIQFSSNTTFTDSDTYVQVVSVPSIEAGALYSLNTTFEVPPLPAGDYYLGWNIDHADIVEESDETNNEWYRTSPVQISAASTDDAYEENDSRESAFNFYQEGTWLSELNGQGIQADDDWYEIQADAGSILLIDCLFSDADGDIDLELYDSSGSIINGAYSVTDNERIELTVPTSGNYYILIYYDDTGSSYDLRWQTFSDYLSPDADLVAELFPGRTIDGSLFTSATRFNWQGYTGNWMYERISANQGLIVKTYDAFSNLQETYREETLFTFETSTAGTYMYREYELGSLVNEDSGTFSFPWLADPATTWYNGASYIQPTGWRYFDWFKGFKPEGENWIYHGRHGWLYVLADDTSGMFLWDVALGRWMFTNETVYPWMYAYGPNGGWLFFFEGGLPGSRYFKRGDNGQVDSELELSTNP